MKVDMQLELFEQALEELAADGDLINQISLEEGPELRILRYALHRSPEVLDSGNVRVEVSVPMIQTASRAVKIFIPARPSKCIMRTTDG